MKAEALLINNIRSLLMARRIDASELAFGVGHSQAWISKILSGERQMRLGDIEAVARYFGLETHQLMAPGISTYTERRRRERRNGTDRRQGPDRRRRATSDEAAEMRSAPVLRRPIPVPPRRPEDGGPSAL